MEAQLKLIVYPMVYRVLATSQVVGLGISEPSKVFQYRGSKVQLAQLAPRGTISEKSKLLWAVYLISSHHGSVENDPKGKHPRFWTNPHFPISKKKSGGGKKWYFFFWTHSGLSKFKLTNTPLKISMEPKNHTFFSKASSKAPSSDSMLIFPGSMYVKMSNLFFKLRFNPTGVFDDLRNIQRHF